MEKLVWVKHKISGQVVELEERHLGGPLGHMYKVVPEGTKSEVLAHPTTEEEIAKREAAEKRALTRAQNQFEEEASEDAVAAAEAEIEAAQELTETEIEADAQAAEARADKKAGK